MKHTLLLAAIFIAFTAHAEPDPGFEPIFDGKTLNGWQAADMSFWSVEDGAITAVISPEHPTDRNHYLVWQGGELGDFELKLTHRIMSEHNVNGGFQFRSEMFDSGIPDDCRGYQVDNNKDPGTPWFVRLYDEFGRHDLALRGERSVFTPEGEKEVHPIESAQGEAWFRLDEWHDYHLICRGPHLTLKINGRIAAEVSDFDPTQQDLSGILALQLHSGPPMKVQFKDIRIKRLEGTITERPIAKGFAGTTVNCTVFRYNSVVTHKNTQFAGFFNGEGRMVLAKRKLGSDKWDVRTTRYKGNVRDAHNVISLMVDGDGYLHVAWDHHNHPLRYARSVAPGSLELTEKMPMVGDKEERVTYPEFYRLARGDLLFFYRDGKSGDGNLMLNRYDLASKKWHRVQDGFINGEGLRNAYWQVCTDAQGAVHVSWCWRETGDVATNHDIGYAQSTDGGVTWQTSTGDVYDLPIVESNAEYAIRIPQNRELMNTTSMCADADGNPYIAAIYRDSEDDPVPQYQLIYHDGEAWRTSQISDRTSAFSLSGKGTRILPMSRPRIAAATTNGTTRAYLMFRDAERDNRVSLAICEDLGNAPWKTSDLSGDFVGEWEPSFDSQLWADQGHLHLFVQHARQGEADARMNVPAQWVRVLEYAPE